MKISELEATLRDEWQKHASDEARLLQWTDFLLQRADTILENVLRALHVGTDRDPSLSSPIDHYDVAQQARSYDRTVTLAGLKKPWLIDFRFRDHALQFDNQRFDMSNIGALRDVLARSAYNHFRPSAKPWTGSAPS